MTSEKISLNTTKVLAMLIENGLIRLPSTSFSPAALASQQQVQTAAKLDAMYIQTFVEELQNLSQSEQSE